MKAFEQPKVEVVEIEVKDILTTSYSGGPIDPELPGDDFED